jgi:alpha/beta superfamily hydrolase
VAPVLGVVDPQAMVAAHDPRPKLLLVPEHDQYRSPAEAEDITAGWQAVELRTLPATDHFLAGAHASIADALVGFLRDLA